MSNVISNGLGGFPRAIYNFLPHSDYDIVDSLGGYRFGINPRLIGVLIKDEEAPVWRSSLGRKRRNHKVLCIIDLHYEVKDLKPIGWHMFVFGHNNMSVANKLAESLSDNFNVGISVEIFSDDSIYQSTMKELKKYRF